MITAAEARQLAESKASPTIKALELANALIASRAAIGGVELCIVPADFDLLDDVEQRHIDEAIVMLRSLGFLINRAPMRGSWWVTWKSYTEEEMDNPL